MPENPKGANDAQSCPQLSVFTYRMPTVMTNSTTATLMITIVALNRALSRIPLTRMAVISSAMTNAGRLKPNSNPMILGASRSSLARCTSCGDFAPTISATLLRNADVPGTRLGSAACASCLAMMFSAVRNAVQ